MCISLCSCIITHLSFVRSAVIGEIPAGESITCTSCQGVEGNLCDVAPQNITTTVNCMGNCVVRRQLYATGMLRILLYNPELMLGLE